MFTQIWIIVLSAVVVGLFVVTRTQSKTNQRLEKENKEVHVKYIGEHREKLENKQESEKLKEQLSGSRVETDACYGCKNAIRVRNGFGESITCILNVKCEDFKKSDK